MGNISLGWLNYSVDCRKPVPIVYSQLQSGVYANT